MQQAWQFYGRRQEFEHLIGILRRRRFFFLKVSGRRRIGKTTLVQEALRAVDRQKMLYFQVPDSDPAGVVSAALDFFALFDIRAPLPRDLRSLAACFASLIRAGYVVAIDEFQYFHRAALYEFTSHLQAEIDRLAAESSSIPGGLIVLGSIHTEMSALLEDRSAPLFNRVTDSLDLGHLDIASVVELLGAHTEANPERLLFLWNLFEGVPKFYRDCYEQDALGADRRTLLRRMFFSSSSPLRTEADNWFLRELRGRYELVLKYVARHPGCTLSDLDSHARSVDPSLEKQLNAYVKALLERYGMIERLQPVFARPSSRNGRFYLRDNFLRSWLMALSTPTAAVHFRPLEGLVAEADLRLKDAEGHGLERLVGALYEERSRKGIGDFLLTARIQGYWDRQGTELDLVALNELDRTVRVGTCKRSGERLVPDLVHFDGHVARFLEATPRLATWRIEKVAVAPKHTPETRAECTARGYIAQDLDDLTLGL